jgi:3-methyladenine DNA glycosylase AlkC
MAEPLIAQYGSDIPEKIAVTIEAVCAAFNTKAFVEDTLAGYTELNLMQRGTHIARALKNHLPGDYPEALKILLASLKVGQPRSTGSLASFFYLPHTCFVRDFGLEHFDISMKAQHRLTQCFAAEFSIRPFLDRYPQESLARLEQWAQDKSEHVRRLVSEGTRPRLPWAPRLKSFGKDPQQIIHLLEWLKDDESPYVRRSVANHLNDIGKTHPALLINVANRWLKDATPQRKQLVLHALRTAIKRGDKGVFELVGYGHKPAIHAEFVSCIPSKPRIGECVNFELRIASTSNQPQRLMIDMEIGYVKANGQCKSKIFKFKTLELQPKETVAFTKKLSFAQMATRKHYPGQHTLGLLINGQAYALGTFNVSK